MPSDRRTSRATSAARRRGSLVWRARWCLTVCLALPAATPARAQQLALSRPATVVRFTSDVAADLAAVPPVLRQPVTLHLRNVTVERALQEVMARTGLSITY